MLRPFYCNCRVQLVLKHQLSHTGTIESFFETQAELTNLPNMPNFPAKFCQN